MMSKTSPQSERAEDETEKPEESNKTSSAVVAVETEGSELQPEIAVSPSVYSATAKILVKADIIGICFNMLQ